MKTDFVPITYFAVPLQKQLLENQENIRGKPYEDFFDPNLKIPDSAIQQVTRGPMDRRYVKTPSKSDISAFVKGEDVIQGSGYAMVDEALFYVQSRMLMPGITSEMMRWWFVWHQLEKERYTLWFPQAHIDNKVADPERLADTSLTFEERLYGNTNVAKEFIGPIAQEIAIHFDSPAALGADREILEQNGYYFSTSAWMSLTAAPETCMGLMFHLGRDTSKGFEFITQYWMGSHDELHRFPGGADAAAFLRSVGFETEALENLAFELSIHDLSEYYNLARILPKLYEKFAGN